ncbi:MAG TPA: hydroxyacylglutathione hydrolase [Gammaproteobacteria bacterium]|nr:hydroxyacylglutathione hydrolase [Gammaproteobacteria bacterium]
MFDITPIAALKDNYIWMISDPDKKLAVVIDPGEAKPVLETLQNKNLNLAGILITHHHWDHTDGIPELLKHFDVPVYRSPLDDKVFMSELDLELSVLTIPGHTLEHIAFVGLGGVFCGDTLFCAGCGRVFEGTYEQMFNSLQLLSQLPDETKIYCGNEYTQKNVEFARAVEPRNSDLILQTHAPSTMGVEKLTNPFLRCDHPIVREAVEKYSGKKLNTPVEVFTQMREWKNRF